VGVVQTGRPCCWVCRPLCCVAKHDYGMSVSLLGEMSHTKDRQRCLPARFTSLTFFVAVAVCDTTAQSRLQRSLKPRRHQTDEEQPPHRRSTTYSTDPMSSVYLPLPKRSTHSFARVFSGRLPLPTCPPPPARRWPLHDDIIGSVLFRMSRFHQIGPHKRVLLVPRPLLGALSCGYTD